MGMEVALLRFRNVWHGLAVDPGGDGASGKTADLTFVVVVFDCAARVELCRIARPSSKGEGSDVIPIDSADGSEESYGRCDSSYRANGFKMNRIRSWMSKDTRKDRIGTGNSERLGAVGKAMMGSELVFFHSLDFIKSGIGFVG